MLKNLTLAKYYDEPNNKYNIISVSVFRLATNYKPMFLYYSGLRKLIDITPQYFEGYYLRIYFDDSIIKPNYDNDEINNEIKEQWLPLIEYAKMKSHVQLVKYHHSDFTYGLGHSGLFGTMVRFIPLFDYDINNNVNIVYVADIDIFEELKLGLWNSINQLFSQFIKSKSKLHFRTKYCYYTENRFYRSGTELYTWRVIFAGTIISKMKFPKYLLDNFIECMKKDKAERKGTGCEKINKFLNIEYEGYRTEDKIKLMSITDFIYGIDEFFMNTDFMKYIFDNKINFSTSVYPDIVRSIYRIYVKYESSFKANKSVYVELMKKIMGE